MDEQHGVNLGRMSAKDICWASWCLSRGDCRSHRSNASCTGVSVLLSGESGIEGPKLLVGDPSLQVTNLEAMADVDCLSHHKFERNTPALRFIAIINLVVKTLAKSIMEVLAVHRCVCVEGLMNAQG